MDEANEPSDSRIDYQKNKKIMRAAEFVELEAVGQAGRSLPAMINLIKVIAILDLGDKQTELVFDNKERILINRSFRTVIESIEKQLEAQ